MGKKTPPNRPAGARNRGLTTSGEPARIVERLQTLADPQIVEGMARFGITPRRAFGVSMPALRAMARQLGRNHDLALAL